MEAEPFYDEYAPEEWGRLERHRTEFAVTLRAVSEFFSPPPAALVDIGGGPGRYAIELARRGYRVTLVDVSGESLRLAREKALEAGVSLQATVHGNALDLGRLETASFDGALLLGPLYHLLESGERVQAIREAMRVLRPGGLLAAAFITRFAPFRNVSENEPDWLAANPDYARQLWESGVHDRPTRFARAYYAHPTEVLPLMEQCGLQTLCLVGVEGVVAGHDEKVNALRGEEWQAWVEWNFELGQDPSLYGASDHLLYLGKKGGQPGARLAARAGAGERMTIDRAPGSTAVQGESLATGGLL